MKKSVLHEHNTGDNNKYPTQYHIDHRETCAITNLPMKGKTMKTLLVTTAVALTVAVTPVQADNFDNFQGYVTAYTGNFEFTVEGTQDAGFTNLEAGYTFLDYGISENLSAAVTGRVGYDRVADTMELTGEYGMAYSTGPWMLYGAAALAYVAPTNNLDGGDFYTTPTLGAGYAISENVSAWGEVEYTWDVSNSFARQGGELEVGMTFGLADNVAIEPSIVRTFDTGNDETQARIGLGFWF